MAFLTRWDEDQSRPAIGEALKDLALRVLLPGLVLWAAIVGIGLLIKGPFSSEAAFETLANRSLAAERDATWNAVTKVMSMVGNTEYVIGVCVLIALLVWWRTKQWWYAVVPLIAISVQATVFVIATALVGRERPPVPKLDPAPPTSSFPSGHVGASTALYFSLALMATRIRHTGLRWAVVVTCLVLPFLVSFARLYRGMHHVTDVVVGVMNGLVCAVLAWLWLRRSGSREHRASDAVDRARTGT